MRAVAQLRHPGTARGLFLQITAKLYRRPQQSAAAVVTALYILNGRFSRRLRSVWSCSKKQHADSGADCQIRDVLIDTTFMLL